MSESKGGSKVNITKLLGPKQFVEWFDDQITLDKTSEGIRITIEITPKGKGTKLPNNVGKFDALFAEQLAEVMFTKIDGTRRYGNKYWDSLGAKGIFVDIARKFNRLKAVIWEEESVAGSETLEDTLNDICVFSIFLKMLIGREDDKRK